MAIFGRDFNYHQPTYLEILGTIPGITGVVMIILMIFSFTLATHSFRRNVIKLPWPFHHLAGFNAFWYAHHLLALVYILFLFHGYFLFLTREWYKKTVWDLMSNQVTKSLCFLLKEKNTCFSKRFYMQPHELRADIEQ